MESSARSREKARLHSAMLKPRPYIDFLYLCSTVVSSYDFRSYCLALCREVPGVDKVMPVWLFSPCNGLALRIGSGAHERKQACLVVSLLENLAKARPCMRTSTKRISCTFLIMLNSTEVFNKWTAEIVRSTLLVFMLVSFCIFLYFVAIILYVFFTSPHVRENARYVLFAHMLINDTLLMTVVIFLFLVVIYLVYIPVPVCYFLMTFSVGAFRVTPYNLAIMSFERYFAICHPLRHAEVCTLQRSLLAIGVMWLLAVIPQFLDFILMCYSMPRNFFSTSLICEWPVFAMSQFQVILRSLTYILTFSLVALAILYTYVKCMMVARKIGSGRSSAFKAEKTVLLHALQLGLCMTSLSSSFTEAYLRQYFYYLPIFNFVLFMCLPRFISPLIYGVRDEVFRKHMMKMNFSVFVLFMCFTRFIGPFIYGVRDEMFRKRVTTLNFSVLVDDATIIYLNNDV
ncbi:odorant receptor 131-2-like [Dendropsophus ebraccatus]|uniref:odorant receptor 131-2-like n=1 Tax=Dendropsophus ebraccatus TaxID=150705 RepID=UPI003831F4F2